MAKKGQKITDPVVLERLKKAREKALITRRKRAEERRQAKLVKALEKEAETFKNKKKLKKMVVSDDEEEENIKTELVEEPREKEPEEIVEDVVPKQKKNNVKVSKTIVHKKRIAYKGKTGEKELFITDCGKFVNVPIKDFNKFMFNHKQNQETIKGHKNKKIKPQTINNHYYTEKPVVPVVHSLQKRLEAQRRLNGVPINKPMQMSVENQINQFQEMYKKMEW